MAPTRRNSRQPDYEEEFEEATGGNGGLTLHLTEGLLPKFTGQDKTYTAAKWVEEIDDNAEIFGWTPVQQLLMARRSLSGTALLWFRSERTYKTWGDLKAAIVREFPDTIDAKTIHEMMSTRLKKSNESCLDYLLIMKELGRRGKMADYVAIKYIIEGIKDDEINKIMLYGVTTYADLKEKLKIYEQLKQNISSRNTEHRSKHEDGKNQRNLRCYSCGELKHASAECPHKERGIKCFKCNEFGHIALNCKMSESPKMTGGTRSNPNAATNGGVGRIVEKGHNTSAAPRQKFCGCSHSPIDDEVGDVSGQASPQTSHHCLTSVTVMTSDTAGIQENNKLNQVKKPTKQVKVCDGTVLALIDSGSDVNLLSRDCYKKLGAPELDKTQITLLGLGAQQVKCFGRIKLGLEIDEQRYGDVVFHVIPGEATPYTMILGQAFLQHCVMLLENNQVSLKPTSNQGLTTKEPEELHLQEMYLNKIDELEAQKIILAMEIEDLKEKQKMSTKTKKIKKIKEKENIEIHDSAEQEHRSGYGYMRTREKCCRTAKNKTLITQEDMTEECSTYKEGEIGAVESTHLGVGVKMKPEYLGPENALMGNGSAQDSTDYDKNRLG